MFVDNNFTLRIDSENFPFWNSDFQITDLISDSISKTSIEWVVVRRKQCPNILQACYLEFMRRPSYNFSK